MWRFAGALVLLGAVLLQPGCALRKGPPDPAKVRKKIAAAQGAERDLISREVGEASRAERLLALLDERDHLVAEQRQRIQAYSAKMAALNADYDAGRDEFEKSVAEYNASRQEWQRDFAELIEAMKAEVTAEEWKAISKFQLKKLNPRELTYEEEGIGG
jgi:hypothetical protein